MSHGKRSHYNQKRNEHLRYQPSKRLDSFRSRQHPLRHNNTKVPYKKSSVGPEKNLGCRYGGWAVVHDDGMDEPFVEQAGRDKDCEGCNDGGGIVAYWFVDSSFHDGVDEYIPSFAPKVT